LGCLCPRAAASVALTLLEASRQNPLKTTRCPRPSPHPAGRAAKLLAVKPSSIYEARRAGNLPYLHIGRHSRFTRVMLEVWLQGRLA
jgi:excisionase family DNA binding protein